MTSHALRRWYLVHRWASLPPTLFLLVLCVTGLPLIFHAEIEAALDPAPQRAAATPAPADIDAIVRRALEREPGNLVNYLGFDRENSVVLIGLAPTRHPKPGELRNVSVDWTTGEPVPRPPPDEGLIPTILELHKSLFAGLPGTLFLGAMGLLLLASLVSGAVVYAPFMRKLAFGTVRRERGRRIAWLDLHNLLGIATLAWLGVVGVTGVFNTLHDPIAAEVRDQLAAFAASQQGLPQAEEKSSAHGAVLTTLAAIPDSALVSMFFPGAGFSTPHHYAVFVRGSTPIGSRMLQAALIDADTGELTDRPEMPWYAKVLFLSQPLHFGDYGGLPLKIIWALFDLVTIFVLVSGLYLWFARRNASIDARIADAERDGVA
jgi:uncharacterized iron-regulated membrane protein